MDTNKYYKDIIYHMPGHVYWKDLDGIFLGSNLQQAKDAGFKSPDQLIGKTDYDMPWFTQAEYLRKIDKSVMNSGEQIILEELFELPDGTKRIYLSNKLPLFDEAGAVSGVLGISFDITDEKNTKKELNAIKLKLDAMTFVSASIAHELRTPLQSLALGVGGIKKFLPALLEAYKKADEKNLLEKKIKKSTLTLLDDLCDSMDLEINSSLLAIDMLLMNLKTEINKQRYSEKKISIVKCIENSISRYPFTKKERQIVHFENNRENDFYITGSDILLSHVLFNLIKNALYHIAKAKKGYITLWMEKDHKHNYLFFRDTGCGIPQKLIPFLFDRFFSGTDHGTGIGLAFSKMVMESLGGKISCRSKEKEYTVFKLTFPKI